MIYYNKYIELYFVLEIVEFFLTSGYNKRITIYFVFFII